jgi:predicted site-specific integrase-resolvase
MADQSAPPLLVSRKEAARLLGVSVMTVIRMQGRGDLRTVPLPTGAVRCLRSEVEALTRKQKRLKLVVPPKATKG